MDIRTNITIDVAKKILGNIEQAKSFLLEMQKVKDIDLPTKIISKGINIGKEAVDLNTDEVWAKIVEHWELETAEGIIRNLFRTTRKYISGRDSYATMQTLFQEWNELNMGPVRWSFSQSAFDGFVQRVNSRNTLRTEKDETIKFEAVKYRRIKEINTFRNDSIENLIFETNGNVLPTLRHNANFDYFINGISFDQKVSKSPTNEFKTQFQENWRNHALEHPETVAEYLYKHQDEGRFGYESRLLVVYLDEDVSFERITQIIQETDLEEPLQISFEYTFRSKEVINYDTNCFVILLYNPN